MTLISAIILMFEFNNQLQNATEVLVNHKFAWAHLVPLSLLVVFSLPMVIIAVRAQYKTRKMYNKVINDIYSKYSVAIANGEDIDEDKAQEVAKVFNEVCPDVEVTVLNGGQPVYYYMISAE